MVNKYFIGSHISERKFRQIVRFFSLDIEAKKTAELTGISRQSINKIYAAIRQRIVDICSVPIQPTIGEFELDESYFGAHRVLGIRGRGARGKIIVFGIFKRPNTIYTYIVNDCSTETLMPIIKEIVHPNAIVITDGFKTYNTLNKEGFKHHFTVNHGENEFAKPPMIHTNGIENFWGGLCKVRFSMFRGINKSTFYLHLKECEFRYNNKEKDIYKLLIYNFRIFPLKLS